MNISRHIGHNHLEMLESILDFTDKFDVNRLLYAINGKHLDEEEINCLTIDIKEQNIKLERQKVYLFKFGKTFNKTFATDDNHYFDTAHQLASKIKSGTKGVKDIFKKFCNVSRKKLMPGKDNPQAIDVSMISSSNYMADLFGLSSYPDSVKELFQTMLVFYDNLVTCINESIRVLNEEKDTKNDSKKCLELLIKACEKSRKNQLHIIEAMEEDPEFKAAILKSHSLSSEDVNPILKKWRTNPKEKFASDCFHNICPKEVGTLTLHQTVADSTGNHELMKIMTILCCTSEWALQVNEAIIHFDSLLPENCKRGKIPAIYLHVFMKWCSDAVGYKSFLNLFNKIYQKNGGRWDTIGSSALSGASVKCGARDKDYDEIEKEMHGKLNKLYPPKPKSEDQII